MSANSALRVLPKASTSGRIDVGQSKPLLLFSHLSPASLAAGATAAAATAAILPCGHTIWSAVRWAMLFRPNYPNRLNTSCFLHREWQEKIAPVIVNLSTWTRVYATSNTHAWHTRRTRFRPLRHLYTHTNSHTCIQEALMPVAFRTAVRRCPASRQREQQATFRNGQ